LYVIAVTRRDYWFPNESIIACLLSDLHNITNIYTTTRNVKQDDINTARLVTLLNARTNK